jgi:peptide deformylase
MHAAKGVGLAAPQICVGLRLMIFGFDENPATRMRSRFR